MKKEKWITPITDIRKVVSHAKNIGVKYTSIVMNEERYSMILNSDEFKNLKFYNKFIVRWVFIVNIIMRINKIPTLKIIKKS